MEAPTACSTGLSGIGGRPSCGHEHAPVACAIAQGGAVRGRGAARGTRTMSTIYGEGGQDDRAQLQCQARGGQCQSHVAAYARRLQQRPARRRERLGQRRPRRHVCGRALLLADGHGGHGRKDGKVGKM
eukprot:1789578-Prymnesium_polylepis.1